MKTLLVARDDNDTEHFKMVELKDETIVLLADIAALWSHNSDDVSDAGYHYLNDFVSEQLELKETSYFDFFFSEDIHPDEETEYWNLCHKIGYKLVNGSYVRVKELEGAEYVPNPAHGTTLGDYE